MTIGKVRYEEFYYLGHQYARAGLIDEAMRSYKHGIDLAPDHLKCDAHYHRGLGMEILGRIDLAIQAYEYAVNSHPGYSHSDAYKKLAMLYRQLGHPHLTDRLDNLAEKITTGTVEYHDFYYLGHQYASAGLFDEAERCYQHSIVLAPDHLKCDAHYHRGLGMEILGRIDLAIQAYEYAVNSHPGSSHSDSCNKLTTLYQSIEQLHKSFQLGINYFEANNYTQAISEFRTLTNRAPTTFPSQYFLALSLAGQQEFTEAKVQMKQAMIEMKTEGGEDLLPLMQQQLEQITESEKQVIRSHSQEFYGIFIGKMPVNTNTKIDGLYRGDDRIPGKIFKEGFKALGKNMDLLAHVIAPGEYSSSDSGYVATSKSKTVAANFPKDLIWKSNIGFLYEINPQKNAIDVGTALLPEVSKGNVHPEDYQIYKNEKEMAVPSKIKPQDIKGAWQVAIIDKMDESFKNHPSLSKLPSDARYYRFINMVQDSYISNPQYIPPSHGITKLGFAMTGVGVVLEGINLLNVYQQSRQSGNYDPFFKESTKVIGGWSGAISLGSTLAGAGVISCGPICGLIGGIAGSVLGYKGGSMVAEIYNNLSHLKIPAPSILKPVLPSTVNQTLSELITKSKSTSEQKQLFNPVNCSASLFVNRATKQTERLKQAYEKTVSVKQGVPVTQTTPVVQIKPPAPKTKREQRAEIRLQQKKVHQEQLIQRAEQQRIAKEQREKARILNREKHQTQLRLKQLTKKTVVNTAPIPITNSSPTSTTFYARSNNVSVVTTSGGGSVTCGGRDVTTGGGDSSSYGGTSQSYDSFGRMR